VSFSGTWHEVAEANLWLRTANRVLVELVRGPCQNREDLYQLAASFPWEEILPQEATFAVRVAGRHPAFLNTHFAALVVKDAVVDRLRQKRGYRPTVNVRDPDVPIFLHLSVDREQEEVGANAADLGEEARGLKAAAGWLERGRSPEPQATLSLDTSGEPLSHRGYRQKEALAPLSEALAAGLLLSAGYDGSQPLIDPMCGSGTILVEAALLACGLPPGGKRRFAFQRWPFFPQPVWQRVKGAARKSPQPLTQPILGLDWDARALALAKRSAQAMGLAEQLVLEQRDVRQLPSLPAGSLVVTNPPYGLRLGNPEDLRQLYRSLGDQLKAKAQGSVAWLLLGNPALAKEVGLRPARKLVVFNGPLRCQFCEYPLVEGKFTSGKKAAGSLAKL
jgi:putative N6-adenine-specific DNA methylase